MYKTTGVSNYYKLQQLDKNPFDAQDSRDPHTGWLFLDEDEDGDGDGERKLLPFRQDRFYIIQNSSTRKSHKVYFIPVIETPVTSNKYMIVMADEHHQQRGLLFTCKEKWTMSMNNSNLSRLEPNSKKGLLQLFSITEVAPNNFTASKLPSLLREKWSVTPQKPFLRSLEHAEGLQNSKKASIFLPEKSVEGLPSETTPVEIGMCYCPFVFIEEPFWPPSQQLNESPLYRITRKKFWRREEYQGNAGETDIPGHKLTVENSSNSEDATSLEVNKESVTVKEAGGKLELFKGTGSVSMAVSRHLKEALIERNEVRNASSRRVEREFENKHPRDLSSYVLVERYTMKRGDGSIAFTRTTVDKNHTFTVALM